MSVLYGQVTLPLGMKCCRVCGSVFLDHQCHGAWVPLR